MFGQLNIDRKICSVASLLGYGLKGKYLIRRLAPFKKVVLCNNVFVFLLDILRGLSINLLYCNRWNSH